MSFPSEQHAYGAHGNPPPAPPVPRALVKSTFTSLTAPLLLLALGLAGFFLGFAPALTSSSSSSWSDSESVTASMFDSSALMVFAMLVLVAGLVGLAGLIPGERPQLWISTVISVVTAATMLCILPNFGDSVSTAWGYWLVFTILLAQAGIALFAIFISAGVITVTANRPAPHGNWQGPNHFPPPQSPGPQTPESQGQPPPVDPHRPAGSPPPG